MNGIRTHNVSGCTDCTGSCKSNYHDDPDLTSDSLMIYGCIHSIEKEDCIAPVSIRTDSAL